MASREPGGYAVTPLPGGRGFHPYQTSVVKVQNPASHPPTTIGFERTCRTKFFCVSGLKYNKQGDRNHAQTTNRKDPCR